MAYKKILLPFRIFDIVCVERSDGQGYFSHVVIDDLDFPTIVLAGAIDEKDARPEHLKDGKLMHEWMGVTSKKVPMIAIQAAVAGAGAIAQQQEHVGEPRDGMARLKGNASQIA